MTKTLMAMQLLLLQALAMLSMAAAGGDSPTYSFTNTNSGHGSAAAATYSSASASESGSSDDVDNSVTALLNSADEVSIGPGLMAAAAIIVGGAICLAGYRLFRPTIFMCGFIVGGIFVAGVAEAMFKNESWMATASWIAFFLGGLAAGALVTSLYSAGIFLAGAAGGVLLAFTLNTRVGPAVYPSNPDVILVILAILLGICGGLLALKIERPVLIVSTAFVGAELFIWGIGYYAGDYPTGTDLKQYSTTNSDGDLVYAIPDAWWAYLAGMVVFFFIGVAVQFKKTGQGNYHGGGRSNNAVPAQANVKGTQAV